jgi:cell division protein FtsB
VVKRRTPITVAADGAAPRKRRRRIETVLIIIGCVLLADVLIGERGLVATRRAHETYERKEQALQDLAAEHDRLSDQLDRLSTDPATIEDEAHEIGLIKPGEILLIIKDVPPTSQKP